MSKVKEVSAVETSSAVISIDQPQSASVASLPSIEPQTALLDIKAAALFLGLSHWQIYGLVQREEIPFVQVGRKIYFRRATLLRWAERVEQKKAG